MAVAVLRVRDQAANAIPDRCVITGAATTGAVRVWATLRPRPHRLYPFLKPLLVLWARSTKRPACRVILPVTDAAWQRLRRPLYGLSAVGGVGVAAMVVAALKLSIPGLVAGALLLVVALLGRWRKVTRHWVQVWIRAGGEEIVVANVSQAFADAARELFVRPLRRR